jgi:hypothetical protein
MEMNIYKPGPLYDKRHHITHVLKSIPLETGDIIFNAADVDGPLGIPFSRLIQTFTKSPYSHATVILKDSEDTYAIDVSDHGTRKLRLVDWFDDWYMENFCVYRLKERTPELTDKIKNAIDEFLSRDPHYDFNFNDPNSFYCTEAVRHIFLQCGIDLQGSYLIKDILPVWFYYIVVLGSKLTKILTNSSIPNDRPITIVGNKEKGMMASAYIEEIFKYDQKLNMFSFDNIKWQEL